MKFILALLLTASTTLFAGQTFASGIEKSVCPSGTFEFGIPPKIPGENKEVTISESWNMLMYAIVLPNRLTIADTYAIKLRAPDGYPDTINYATAANLAVRKHFCASKVSAINGDTKKALNGCIGIVGTC